MKRLCCLIAIITVLTFCGAAGAEEMGSMAEMKPAEGWALHIDAKRHIPDMPDMVAHHYCKTVAGGLTECQLYDSDRPDARLIGVEVVVDAATYEKFSWWEKRRWHYHKTEIPLVDAELPGLSAEEAEKLLKSMEETYGKVYILWNPKEEQPVGKPVVVSILH